MASSGSGAGGGGAGTIYIVLGVIVLIVLRRMLRVFRGSRVSTGRTIGYSAYYFAFAVLLIGVSYAAGGTSSTYLVLYAIVGALGVYGSYLFSDRRIGFWRADDGGIYYRGAVIIYLIYLVAFIARITIDLVFIGPSAFSFTSAPNLSATAIDAGIVTDLLLCLGAGLLIGRNIRVLKRYNGILAGREHVSDVPPKITYL
jgi:hypothetical protein